MDFDRILNRIKNLVIQPAQEWDAIERERLSVADIYTTYLLIVAAVPALALFLNGLFVGVRVGVLSTMLFRGLESVLFLYIFNLLSVYVAAFVMNKLAPTFKSTPNLINAVKLTGFTCLLIWAAGVLYIVPALAALMVLVAFYSFYILYVGLPKLMNTPKDKTVPYMLVTAAVILVLWLIVGEVSASVRGGL